MEGPNKLPPTYQAAIAAVARNLRDFGYGMVTADQIDKAHDNWRAGKEPADIIERFAFGDFDKYPDHFGRKDEPPSQP